MKRMLAILLLLLAAWPAAAQQPAPGDVANDLPAGVAEEQITVSSDYGGSFVTVFGVNPDRRGRGDIVPPSAHRVPCRWGADTWISLPSAPTTP